MVLFFITAHMDTVDPELEERSLVISFVEGIILSEKSKHYHELLIFCLFFNSLQFWYKKKQEKKNNVRHENFKHSELLAVEGIPRSARLHFSDRLWHTWVSKT